MDVHSQSAARALDAAAPALQINAAVRRLGIAHRARTAALLARQGVRIGQELLMLELASRGECTQASLSAAARTEPSTITVALRKLEAAGLVERSRSSDDGRAQLVRLTEAGEALVPELLAIQSEVAAGVVSGLPEGLDVDTFVAALTTITDRLDA